MGRTHRYHRIIKPIRNNFGWLLIIMTTCLLGVACTWENGSQSRPIKRVLFIGNSYTASGGLPLIVEDMINSGAGTIKIKAKAVTKNGADWESLYKETHAARAIRRGHYDVVIIQNHSRAPLDERREHMVEDAGRFNEIISEYGGKTYLFCTWARKHMPKAQKKITAAYCKVADHIGAFRIPIGAAWKLVSDRKPAIELFSKDGSHPSPEGIYLTASVIYGSLTGKTPVGNPVRHILRDGGQVHIEEDTARLLQIAAWDTIRLLDNTCGVKRPNL